MGKEYIRLNPLALIGMVSFCMSLGALIGSFGSGFNDWEIKFLTILAVISFPIMIYNLRNFNPSPKHRNTEVKGK